MAEVARVAHPLELAPQPLVLRGERVLERERLAAERDLVVVVRERAVDRVADERDQPRLRDERRDALRRERMEEVARARLADDGSRRGAAQVRLFGNLPRYHAAPRA